MTNAPKRRTSGLLESAFRIRPGEARLVGIMVAYLLAVVSTFIIGRAVRDGLYLRPPLPADIDPIAKAQAAQSALRSLPLMYVATAGAVSLAAYAYSRVADRMRRDRLALRGLIAFAVINCGFYALIESGLGGDWSLGLLYVVVEIVGALSMIQFWTLAGDVFSGQRAKRLFSLVGAGGVLANVVCGFAIGALVPVIGAEKMLLVVAGLFTACAALAWTAGRIAQEDLELAIQTPRGRIGVTRDTGAVLSNTHLKLIAALIVVTFVTVKLVDYQFLVFSASQAQTGTDQLTAFFGNFQGVVGVIACLTQVFITGRLIERAGLIPALLVLPSMMALGVASIALIPLVSALFAATLAKGADSIFRYTVNDASSQLLYLPVPSSRRGRAKAFIDGIVKPSAIGVAGLFLYLCVRSIYPTGEEVVFDAFAAVAIQLAWVDAALLLLWIGLVLRMKRAYVSSLVENLYESRVSFDGAWVPAMNDQAVLSLRTRLRSDKDEEVLHALELLPRVEVDLDDELEALLVGRCDEVRVAALNILGQRQRFETIGAVRDRLEDPSGAIRSAAVEAYCAIGRERAIRLVQDHLEDEDLSVRGSTCSALITHSGLHGVLAAAKPLKGLLTDLDPQARRVGARVLAQIQVKSFVHPLLDLMEDDDPQVRLEAVRAAGAMKTPELVPALIYRLADPTCGRAAVRALAGYGTEVEAILFQVLSERREALEVRRQVPSILGAHGGERALKALVGVLNTRDPELRAAAAKEAARIAERTPRARADDDLLNQALRREFRGAYQTLAIIEDLEVAEDELLHEALSSRYEQRVSLIFRLLEIRHPGRAMKLVHANLKNGGRNVRASAVEVADNLISREEARALMPLLDEVDRPAKVQKGEELFTIHRMNAEAWLPHLLNGPLPWTTACALDLVRSRQFHALHRTVMPLTKHRDPIVRETAYVTLAGLSEGTGVDGERLKVLAQTATQDPVAMVRQAGAGLLRALD